MRQAMDIEGLLRWAYRDELAKRQTSSAEAIWAKLADWRELAAAVDLGTSNPQRYDLGMPAPDALLIEQAVGRLADRPLDWQSEALSVLGDLLALVEPRQLEIAPAAAPGRTSTKVSWPARRGGRDGSVLDVPRQVVLGRSIQAKALVTMHAVMGTRPDWCSEYPRPRHVPAERGSNAKIVGECRGRNWYSTGSYCPLRWEPSPITIAEARADYLIWWHSLALLAQQLSDCLEKFLALPPAAPTMPWLEQKIARHVVEARR